MDKISDIKNIIVIDTEFISSRSGGQPFQIAMHAFELKKRQLKQVGNFNIFILLREGIKLNFFARKYTGITDKKLNAIGVYPNDAILQVVNFLLSFNLEKTLVVGWDPGNDVRMLDILLNYNEDLIDVNKLNWFDLMISFKKNIFPQRKDTPSLKEACQFYNINDVEFHDAENDVIATTSILKEMFAQNGIEQTLLPFINQAVRQKYIKKR